LNAAYLCAHAILSYCGSGPAGPSTKLSGQIDRLLKFENKQMLLRLLRLSICSKFNYCLRLVHPDVLLSGGEKYGDAIDKLLLSAFNKYLNYDETCATTDAVGEQVHTPLKLGGLDFLHAPHTRSAAHLASLLDCNKQVETLYNEATKSRPAEQVQSLELGPRPESCTTR
jgi:hypothetical protein